MATRADDHAALERVAAQWREECDASNITVESVICDGCLDGGRKCSHCADCEIRACAVERGVTNCADCSEYACERLEGFFGFVPDARAVLDQVRRSL
ncbi:MAG: DUF3795 domain-containing protein [Anaerolineae bacterium]|nr:DUF3795 domain-containing protein [Anaerolineae bacterium]